MGTLAKMAIKWPWLTVIVILGISAFFGYHLQKVYIDNEVSEFLPEFHPDRQQYYHQMELYGGELAAIISVTAREGGQYPDLFNPESLQVLDELTTWLSKDIKIKADFKYNRWATLEDAEKIVAARDKNDECGPEDVCRMLLDYGFVEDIDNLCPQDLLAKMESAAAEEESEPVNHDEMVKVWSCKAPMNISMREEDVLGLANVTVIYNDEDNRVRVDELWDEGAPPSTQEEADHCRSLIGAWEMYGNNVASIPEPQTGYIKSSAIYAFLPEGISIEFSEQLQEKIDAKLQEMGKKHPDLEFQAAGLPLIDVMLGKYLNADLRLLIPFVFFVVLAVLIISFRTATGVLMPFITVSLGTLWTVGLSGLLGKPLTLLTSAIPTLITAVGSAYTIHMIHNIQDARRKGVGKREAIVNTMTQIGPAVLMAGLTTVGGFFSLASSSVVPVKDFGLLASFGTLACLIISIILVPALLVIFMKETKEKRAADQQGEKFGTLDRMLQGLAGFINRHRPAVFLFMMLLFGVSILLTMRVKVTSNLASYFHEDSEIRLADDYVKDHLGGANIFYLTLNGGKEDYWKDPDHLRKLDELVDYLHAQFPDLIGKTVSLTDYLKKFWKEFNEGLYRDFQMPPEAGLLRQSGALALNRTILAGRKGIATAWTGVNPGQDYYYRISLLPNAVGNSLSMLSGSVEKVVDEYDDYSRARVMVKMTDGYTHQMGKLNKDIKRWILENWPELAGQEAPAPTFSQRLAIALGLQSPPDERLGTRYKFSGEMQIRWVVDQLIIVGQMRSVFLSVLVVFILTAIIFRSLVGGLLSVIPTIAAVLVNFALMGAANIALDIGTSLVSAAAMGMGIDYAIHYINRYRLARSTGHRREEAVVFTHLTSGKAIVFNALAVALGFFVLLFSNFNPVISLGLLTGITMFTASFIALTLLPVLLVWFKPRFIRKVATADDNGNENANRKGEKR